MHLIDNIRNTLLSKNILKVKNNKKKKKLVKKEKLNIYLAKEKEFSYKNLSMNETIKHIIKFTYNIWRLIPFIKGSTRVVAIFMIKYLRTLGLNINSKLFSECSESFKDALIESNKGSITLLEKLFSDLLSDAE